MIVAAATVLLLAACVEPLSPDGDAGSQLESCADLGCSTAFCTSSGACSCVPPDAAEPIACLGDGGAQ